MSDWLAGLLCSGASGILNSWGEGSMIAEAMNNANSGNSLATQTANNAIFVPVILAQQMTVTQMATVNGSSVSGNIDLGIYDMNYTRLVSCGSTAQAGVSTIQVVSVASTVLVPGLYQLAIVFSAGVNVNTLNLPSGGVLGAASGVKSQGSAFPLPATAAPTGVNSPPMIIAANGAIL